MEATLGERMVVDALKTYGASSPAKIAAILAVLVILIMIPYNLSAILPNW